MWSTGTARSRGTEIDLTRLGWAGLATPTTLIESGRGPVRLSRGISEPHSRCGFIDWNVSSCFHAPATPSLAMGEQAAMEQCRLSKLYHLGIQWGLPFRRAFGYTYVQHLQNCICIHSILRLSETWHHTNRSSLWPCVERYRWWRLIDPQRDERWIGGWMGGWMDG